jgi:hypothetical protein
MEYRAAKEVLSHVFPFFTSLSFFCSPHFFMREEHDGKATIGMQADAGVCKGTQLFSGPCGVETEVARP